MLLFAAVALSGVLRAVAAKLHALPPALCPRVWFANDRRHTDPCTLLPEQSLSATLHLFVSIPVPTQRRAFAIRG